MTIRTPDASPPSRPGRAATPIAFIRAIVLAYRRYGIDPAGALAKADIDPAMLDDPEARVTAAQMELISGHAMQELDDEALGWFSRRLPWGSYGLLCRASLGSPDLGVALKRWCRHHRLLTDDIGLALALRVGLSVAGGMNNAVHTGWLPAEQTWGQLNSDTINGAAVVPPESPTSTNDATA